MQHDYIEQMSQLLNNNNNKKTIEYPEVDIIKCNDSDDEETPPVPYKFNRRESLSSSYLDTLLKNKKTNNQTKSEKIKPHTMKLETFPIKNKIISDELSIPKFNSSEIKINSIQKQLNRSNTTLFYSHVKKLSTKSIK